MLVSELIPLLTLATASSFTPGPNTTLSTALAANGGLRRALPFVVAVPLGWGLLLILCAAGLGALLLAAPILRWVVQAVGMAYLLWLAWRLASTARLGALQGDELRISLVRGVLLQFVNIKAWMLALAIVAGWIAGKDDAALRLATVLPIMMAFGFFSNLSYALVGALLRDWLAGPYVEGRGTAQRLVWFNRCMAGALVATVVWMIRLI